MEKMTKKTDKKADLPANKSQPTPEEQAKEDDVERLLEHIMSPYRWELLDSHSAKSEKHKQPKSTK